MKIRYLNGIKMCVIETNHGSYKHFAIYNYHDIVCALNYLFKQAHLSPEGTGENSIMSGDNMGLALMDIASICNLPVKNIYNHDREIIFDDEKRIKKTRKPRLQLPRYDKLPADFHGFKVIIGGKNTSC